mmetsp:Transcript_15949/g.30160  ORF Transcript_15949/g.30160 Transcript_15949/m.30160 type:complete len:93 (+) Transcript_15949:1-279(+)
MCSKEFRGSHNDKLDEPYERAKELGRAGDLSQLAPGNKVAVKNHPQTLSCATKQWLKDRWQETMQPLGYEDYETYANAFREINQKRFFSNNV